MMMNPRDKSNIFIALILAHLGGSLAMSAIPIALPSIALDLSMNAVQTGWISLALSLITAVLILPFGRLADIVGRKKIFSIGLFIVVAGMIVSALSVSWGMLMSFQVITGIGAAMITSTGMALLSSVFAPAERGKVLGIVVASIYAGQSLGPTIGGILTYNIGWRSIFIPSVILQIASLVFILLKIKGEWAEARGEKFDIAGSALFAIMLFCLLYGFSAINQNPGVWIILAGICLLALFVYWELKARSPMLDLKLLTGNRFFAFSGLTHFFFYIIAVPIPFIMSLYLQYILGFNPQVAGFILLIQPVMMAILSPIAGRISDRVESRRTVSIGISIVLLGILFLFAATTNLWLPGIIIGLLLVGFGYAFFASPNTNAIIGSAGRKHYGVAAAFESTMRSMGMTFGMGAVILLFSLNLGSAQITPEYYVPFQDSVKTAFIIFAVFCVLSILASATRGRMPFTSEK